MSTSVNYAQKSAMHIPLIVLGFTKSSLNLVNGLLAHGFEADEVEFFGQYTSHLNH